MELVEVPDPHLRMNQISAISNRGEVRFMTYAKAMNAALFLVFLGRLLPALTTLRAGRRRLRRIRRWSRRRHE